MLKNNLIRTIKQSFLSPCIQWLKSIYLRCDKIYTYNTPQKSQFSKQINNSFVDLSRLKTTEFSRNVTVYLISKYLNHEFDLLGSGWVSWRYSSEGPDDTHLHSSSLIKEFDSKGQWLANVVKSNHLNYSSYVWRQIQDKTYQPIDWHRDVKSGFRWSAKKYHLEQRQGYILTPGADIKLPWEISRLQHLPQMACFAKQYPEYRQKLTQEFKNQMLDFIASNPVKMGVNWTCTMDVAIRGANMALAYDLFVQCGHKDILDEPFIKIFSNSLYQHAYYTVTHLEYNKSLRSNHYLANIAGLLFMTAYLDGTKKINQWLAFSIQEIFNELKIQFYEEGTNFEASTSYHRLSSEMVFYSVALIKGLPKERVTALKLVKPYIVSFYKRIRYRSLKHQAFSIKENKIICPEWAYDRIFKSAEFTSMITNKKGNIAQIGDNDNGRFFKFTPIGEFQSKKPPIWEENILNHSSLLSACNGFFEKQYFQNVPLLEESIIRTLCQDMSFSPRPPKSTVSFKTQVKEESFKTQVKEDLSLQYGKTTTIPITTNTSLLKQNMKIYGYEEFGLYIIKSDHLHLTFSATDNGQLGNGGHAHNDKLSITLTIDHEEVLKDPGTYNYTAYPDLRNKFRSTAIHNVPYVNNTEQNNWEKGRSGLFKLNNETDCFVLNATQASISLWLSYKNIKQIRTIKILDHQIKIIDQCNHDFTVNFKQKSYSPHYGKRI